MRFCDSDACQFCALADQPDIAPCHRRKALFCMGLSKAQTPPLRAALEELSLQLMDEATALDRERAIPLAPAE